MVFMLQVGSSLAFVIHESANPHIGKYPYLGLWKTIKDDNFPLFNVFLKIRSCRNSCTEKEWFRYSFLQFVISQLIGQVGWCQYLFLAAVLGRLPGTTVYRNIQQYPEAYTYNGIVVVRIDAPIYFANISYIKDRWKLWFTSQNFSRAEVSYISTTIHALTYIDLASWSQWSVISYFLVKFCQAEKVWTQCWWWVY